MAWTFPWKRRSARRARRPLRFAARLAAPTLGRHRAACEALGLDVYAAREGYDAARAAVASPVMMPVEALVERGAAVLAAVLASDDEAERLAEELRAVPEAEAAAAVRAFALAFLDACHEAEGRASARLARLQKRVALLLDTGGGGRSLEVVTARLPVDEHEALWHRLEMGEALTYLGARALAERLAEEDELLKPSKN